MNGATICCLSFFSSPENQKVNNLKHSELVFRHAQPSIPKTMALIGGKRNERLQIVRK